MTRPRLTAAAAAAASVALAVLVGVSPAQEQRRSGFDDMAPETQAMQRDDTANPGMLWVQEGEALWERRAGRADRACAGCHGDAAVSMRVAARYPAFDEASGAPLDLAGRINRCRTAHQGADPYARESPDLLAVTAFVAHQSRGVPFAPPDDPRLVRFRERGREVYEARRGQLDLSCAQCHDVHAGRRLAGSVIPQGHPTGYPLYRLEWQGTGSLQRRLRGCMVGVRSEPYPYGSEEYVDLELFLV